jgi:cytochrome b6
MHAVIEWLDDRLGLSVMRDIASHKTVPAHRFTILYYLGGMTLFFFLVQVCTGVLLMLYYRPSAEEAFESVEFIMTTVPFGWLIRSVHSWSANLMVFFAFLHLLTVFFMKAYRAPRELTWVSGVLVLFLVMGFGFSGYLLPWNQLAFFATKVGTDIAGVMPGVGPWMVRFLRGGDRVSGATLSRFYGWHVAILPAITFLLLGMHLAMVQLKGMSVPKSAEAEAKSRTPMKFFPHFALRDLTGWVVALGFVAAIAALFPWELGDKADLFAPAYENIRPEWYFVFMFQTLKLVPGGSIFGIEYEAIPIALFGLGGLLLMAVPFLDRKQSKLVTPIGLAVLAFIIGMTCWGYGTIVPLLVMAFAASVLVLLGWFARNPRVIPMIILVFLAFHARGADVPSAHGTARVAGRADETSAPLQRGSTSCVTCHDKITIAKDVHSVVGLSCHDCHGGNPAGADMQASMDPKFAKNPFRGKPKRQEIPDFCGRCHSDAAFMKQFNPAARVDQVSEYWSSRHGQLLKQGDTNVAVCIDCHSVHDIRRRSQQDSPVYKTHVAETCSRCHSDAVKMAKYGIPVDQYARWKVSVHARAVLEKGDVAAPTCNDCHGNHGATPPGVEAISFVCGRCHAREAELFRKSPKHAAWTQHNEMMNGMSCASCHPDGVRAKVTVTHFSECITCHENHGVVRPTIALLGTLPETPCAFCHEGTGPLAARIAEMPAKAEHFRQVRSGLLQAAQAKHLAGNERFDWLVDQALQLPFHHAGAEKEFSRLFDKFRIGKTHYSYRDVATGKDVSIAVRNCGDCHDDLTKARTYLEATRGLTSMIGRADRILLAAHRGGVEVRKVRSELDSAIDSQIELETLVHTFGSGDVAAKQKEGLQHAEAALVAGQSSLDELSYRRKGLLVALGIIVMVLIGLVIKIRTLP